MDYPESQRGICLTCGFLSKHAKEGQGHVPTPRFYEIEMAERKKGKYFTHSLEMLSVTVIRTLPACIRFAHDLPSEMYGVQEDTSVELHSDTSVAIKVINADRQCAQWYAYQPSFSPKEHLEMYNSEQLFTISQKIQADAVTASNRNLAATIIFGIIVVLLSIMQLRASRNPQPIIIQVPTQQSEPLKPEANFPQ